MTHFANDDQITFRDLARKFARTEIEPIANAIDRDDSIPPQLMRKIADLGFFGLMIPEEYGGLGSDLVTTTMVIEEFSKSSPALGGLLAVQFILCPETIAIIGDEEQKRRLLPPMATGDKIFGYSNTEPGGGMNLPAHQTRITADGDGYRLNGAKLFCTQGHATSFLVMGRTRVGDREGQGCVLVERDAPGLRVEPLELKLGWMGTNTGPLSFDNVFIPPENVLGDLLAGGTLGGGHRRANDGNNIAHAASSLGAVEGLYEKTLEQVKMRNLYGAPMYHLQPISYWLGVIYARIEAMRAMVYAAARLWDERSPTPGLMAGATKFFVCEEAFDCVNKLLQMWGGSGMMNSTGVNRYMRDARVNMIAEGADEMMTSLIAENVLGLTTDRKYIPQQT